MKIKQHFMVFLISVQQNACLPMFSWKNRRLPLPYSILYSITACESVVAPTILL